MSMSESHKPARLVVLAGPARGEVFLLGADDVSIGREPANAVWIPDRGVSRTHCELSRLGETWQLRDLGSSNGTFVNGLQASVQTLDDGDQIAVGASMLLFVRDDLAQNAGGDPAPTVTSTVPVDALLFLTPAPAGTVSREEEGLRALLAMSAILHTVRTEDDLYREVLQVVERLTSADAVRFVVPGQSAELECVAGTDAVSTLGEVDQGIVRRVIEERRGVMAASASLPAAEDAVTRSVLCVPVSDGSSALGAIYVMARRSGAFEPERLPLLVAIGHFAGIALQRVRKVTRLEHDAARVHADMALQHSMIGESEPMRRVYDRISRVARSQSTVLLMGETGTGKELAARAIHLNGPRALRPFVAINCAAVAEQLLESEMFGHERGAFTGAVTQKRGRFELADGGTLFLDEVAELTPALQSKLLRALQEQEFERVGGTRTIKVDVRIIAATNATLSDEVAKGRFRADLYFRLNVVSITLPPLRERRADIPPLARFFLERFRSKAGRRVTQFSAETMACLQAYVWPGNVRELQNIVERAVVLGLEAEIGLEDLPDDVVDARVVASAGKEEMDYHAAVVATKRQVILEAYRNAGGSYVGAARLLRVHPNYLHRLIRILDLKPALEEGGPRR